MMPNENSSRELRKFGSPQEQEEETRRYWKSRTILQKMQAVAQLTKHAYSIRPIGVPSRNTQKDLPVVFDQQGQVVPQSRILRKFKSHQEQELWNKTYARLR